MLNNHADFKESGITFAVRLIILSFTLEAIQVKLVWIISYGFTQICPLPYKKI